MILDKNNKEYHYPYKDAYLKNKGVYKFYVKKDMFNKLANNLKLNVDNINPTETKEYNNEKFICVYVGQTQADKGFYSRVVRNHILGKGKSTLRRSLKGVLQYSNNKIDEFFNDENNYIFEVTDIPKTSDIDFKELESINSNGFKILNLSDNRYYLESNSNIKSYLWFKSLR